MKFKLKPHPKNLFPKGAVLIDDGSPRVWLQEIQKMGFSRNDITVYPVPSAVANRLYGCLLVFKQGSKRKDIGRNRYFQNIKDKLFLPENTMLSPTFSEEEWGTVFSKAPYVYHTDFGLVELGAPVNWTEILTDFKEQFPSVLTPSKGTSIPGQITSIRMELDEAKILKQLEDPISEQEVLDKLPFDMKKVLSGNQKEMDKYFKFLDENPEMALKYAVPLDVLNTNRERLNGRFVFSKNKGRRFASLFKRPKFLKSSGTERSSSLGVPKETESLISSYTTKMLFRMLIIVLITAKGLSFSSGVFIGLLKVFFYGAILIGVLYLVYKFLNREPKEPHKPFDYSNYTNGNYRQADNQNPNISSTLRKTDVYKFLPFVVVGVIIGMSILFVKYASSNLATVGGSPLLYIVGMLVLIFLVIFMIVKLFEFIDSSLKRGTDSGSADSGSVALLDSDRFSSLRSRYEKLAQDFIDKKEYEKAAHIYRRLLKDNYRAAKTLEEGELYQEAAAVYLKFCQNKEKAAECYEKGRSYKEAIELYKALGQTEKVGDLYVLMHQKKEANVCFYKVIEEYKANSQYVKASLVLRNKVKDSSEAQEMLLEGWRTNQDAVNCLNNYFVNVTEIHQLQDEIRKIYDNETNENNLEAFLKLLKIEFKKDKDLEELTRDIAYEIIADKIENKPDISSELLHFNKNNTSITKDIMKFKWNSRKRN